jgi:mycothiol system anti-sigma-R factor
MGNVFSNMSNAKKSPCKNGTDCSKFNQLIHSMIDGEMNPSDKEFFEKHADDCVHCLEHYGAEKDFIAEIRAKLARRCCPDALLQSIKNKISQLK